MTTNVLTNNISGKLFSLTFPKLSLKALWLFSFILIFSFLGFYIVQVNEATRAGFLISDYEKKIAETSQQNKNLEIFSSQNSSPADLEAVLLNLNYEKVDKINYIQILDSSMVANPRQFK